MLHCYCSATSRDYIYKVLALYLSMEKYDKCFKYFIICMSHEVLEILSALKLENMELIDIQDVEADCPELAEVKKTRTDKEYVWTVKPSAILHVFRKSSEIDHVLWLDGDTMFLSDPEPIFEEWGNYSVLLSEERYSGKYEYMSWMYGYYNTGLLGFKKDDNAIQSLTWLKEKVDEWCYDRMENGLWSDQLYVTEWPKRFNYVKVLKNIGVNMTPFILWRLLNDEDAKIKEKESGIYVNNNRLILFHYYGFRYLAEGEYDLCSYKNWGFIDASIRTIYRHYMTTCEEAVRRLKESGANLFESAARPLEGYGFYYRDEKYRDKKQPICNFCTITTLEYLPKCLALLYSIEKHCDSFHLHICCMDDAAYGILARLQPPNTTLYRLAEIEDDSLRKVRAGRKEYEYCWTLKAPFIMHIFDSCRDVYSLLYLDSDMFLFSEPGKYFEILQTYPVLLTSHNFSKRFLYLYDEKGRYNAGIVGFNRSIAASRRLKWWRKKCIEWCYDIIGDGRFADQKYLEEFAKTPGKAYIEASISGNAAIWNIRDTDVDLSEDSLYIEGKKLVFYHFSSFQIFNEYEFDLWKWDYLQISELKKQLIYMPYVEAIAKAVQDIKPYAENLSIIFTKDAAIEYSYNYISMKNIEQ